MAPQADPGLSTVADALRALLPDHGGLDWLAADQAVDIAFRAAPADLPQLRGMVSAWRNARAIDIVLQPEAGRRKRLLLADMDSTMIGQECIDELADVVGLKPQVAAITERAMRGDLQFEPALRERVALLRGLPVAVVDEVLKSRITLTPGGSTLVATMKAHSAATALVSGGFTLFTGPVAARIGFDENHGNTLLVADGKLSGYVAEPILGRDAKLATLNRLREAHGLAQDDTMAIGDGANDLGMIEAAGLGVAFHAKPAVAAVAGARIDHGDLTALLFVQGYRREAFSET